MPIFDETQLATLNTMDEALVDLSQLVNQARALLEDTMTLNANTMLNGNVTGDDVFNAAATRWNAFRKPIEDAAKALPKVNR